jgi:hypothetical protein
MKTQDNLKHIMFIHKTSLVQIKKIIKNSKFNKSIQIEENQINLKGQIIRFRFCNNSEFNIIGMESNIINSEDHNRFYSIAEYIGKEQINLYNLQKISNYFN